MRLASILALALFVAVPAPMAAVASERVTGVHEHRVQMYDVVRGPFKAATALAPPLAIVPAARSDDDKYDGLSRHSDDCNYGCIDNN
jgi:hypothetical protein